MTNLQDFIHFQSTDSRFVLSISKETVEDMTQFCRDAVNLETGGILIGRYSEDQKIAIVDEVTGPPPDSKHFLARFLRGVQGLQELLNRMWSKHEKRFYIGEWHYHPLPNVNPSRDDIAQMNEIARSNQYYCPEPILFVIAGPPTIGWQFSATVHPRDGAMVRLSRYSKK